MSLIDKSSPFASDVLGAGQIINSEVAKRAYDDGLSSPLKEVGALSTDILKACRLFTAPFQLAAAWQDRLASFCERVRERVPEEHQCEAAPEIARPVIEALPSTSDDSPMMRMFEELMSQAIDRREAAKLNPEFPELIKSLSPLEAVLIAKLKESDQFTDKLLDRLNKEIVKTLGASFDAEEFGGTEHHFTITQHLESKGLVTYLIKDAPKGTYPNVQIPEDLELRRFVIRLTSVGRWFASTCVAQR